MDSDKSEEDEHEAISKQIVEYYKKYSLSQQLPKYFSGTSLSYMPKIVKDEEINKPAIIIEDTSKTLVPKQSEYCQTDVEETAEPKPISPASSVTSTRKLEWDSGADIGYNNCNKSTKLQKSFSLPTLIGTSDYKTKEKSSKTKLSSHIVNVISYSSTSDHAPEKTTQPSSSSSSYRAEAPLASFSSSSSAKPPSAKPLSTSSSSSARPPEAKPLSSSSSSNFANTLAYLKRKIGSPEAESTPRGIMDYKSTVNSYETPFVPKSYKKLKNRVIELCITKPIAIECTDGKKKKALDKRVQTSFVEKISKSVQTGEDTIDGLDTKNKGPKENQSVIMIRYECESDKKTYSSNTQTDSELIPSPESDQQNNLRRTQGQSNLATSTDSSKEIPPLGQLISRKQSKSLMADIDRSIELLQKLLKSKKYDSATKKRYIKKIVAKIVDNKYNEDSTTSSEFFMPKKRDDKVQQKLQENIPWYPPKISKFGVKTFKDEFLPEESKKKSMFTLSEAQYTPTSCLDRLSSLEKPQNTTSGSGQSWKEDKTLSERLFEEKQKGEGDHLVNFAMKERQNQIEWINDEISHLIKLKDLLEQNQIQTTTTVYMVSQQYDKQDSGSDRGRNYIIQTEIPHSSSEEVLNINNKVQMEGKRSRKNSNLAGEIEVFSDEQTTSIRVKAKANDGDKRATKLPRKPTLVGTGKYDTYPRSKQEEQRCWPCGMMQARRDRVEGLKTTDRYSFDVPLSTDATTIIKKVDEIVSKYGSKSSMATSSGSTSKQKHEDQVVNKCECKASTSLPGTCLCKCKCKEKKDVFVSTKQCGCKKADVATCTVKHGKLCLCQGKCEEKKGVALRYEEVGTCTEGHVKICHCKCKCQDKNKEEEVCDKNTQCTTDCVCKQKSTSTYSTQYDSDIRRHSESTDKSVETEDSGRKSHEVFTYTDDIVSKRTIDTQCSCLEAGATQTDAFRYTKDEEVQKDDVSKKLEAVPFSLGTSTISDFSSTTGDSIHSCVCCKQKNVTAKHLYELRKKLSDDTYPLCKPCYRENRRCAYSYNTYTNAGHVCNCYTMVKTKTLDAIKKTLGDLEEMEYCSCVDVDNGSNSSCCQYCRKKLKRTSKNRNGIAYLVTFENGTPYVEEKRKTSLEEIKIKIPAVRKKKHKDKENKRRKNSRTSDREEEGEKGTDYTLQEYLNKNRPDFVQTAEGRWRAVKDSKSHREEVADLNKLKFLQNYESHKEKNSKRLFSEKEMKEITRRNYRKLPEVQQRLVDNKRKQILKANRLIADTFNRKLREKVLKGKITLPTDVNVVNL